MKHDTIIDVPYCPVCGGIEPDDNNQCPDCGMECKIKKTIKSI